ncbi:type I-E CRISPR-associated protein Cas7/Cse4/CasC [Aedoeadaptatus coxii]|uniref:CRISPR system CASCADE complex protein CasC n=1 Tax=Aedoeadaptatus coxii TaxID=755172 RepID=A0A134ALD7_9FIRM|nr:type I-E CRISPR-associated protein Cas7/Cse4/CasC [Peptoniphilus coxii]KXB68536.1 CRISPR system CASCADE complex protein CasC [Peptoniphilus coxii]
MNKQRLFVDVHAIQTVPPSNINRDDTGSPKTALYGGVRRARVSSQAWKRAIRLYFNEHNGSTNVGVRTKQVVDFVVEKMMNLDPDISEKEATDLVTKTFNRLDIKTNLVDDRMKTQVLLFLGDAQAKALAEAALSGVKDKKKLQAVLKENPAVDIALFGRMVAKVPSLKEEASCQVAHAISTHGVQTEFDFFTAVDDMAPEDNAGAGMLGTVEYNSSTLYRYGNIAAHELLKQLGDKEQVIRSICLFVESFVNAMPTGKINTFGNQTLPQALVVVLREDRPVNLVSAYEEPVHSVSGYVKPSIEKLFNEMEKAEVFVQPPKAVLYLNVDDSNGPEAGKRENLNDLLESLKTSLEQAID